MFTYRKDLAKKHWHRPWPLRVLLLLLGLFICLIGAVGWSIENVYGGDVDRQEYVIGHDAELGRAFVYGEGGEVVYEATNIADAEAYVESQRGGRNYTVPILFWVTGILLLLLAVGPSPVNSAEPAPTLSFTVAVRDRNLRHSRNRCSGRGPAWA